MNPADVPLEALFRRLHLANAPRIYKELCARAEEESWSYRDFLAVLMAEEVAHRKQTRIQRLTRKARFPFLKTIDDFDFTYQSTLRLQMLGSHLSPDFVTDGRSLVLAGKSGRGKTHLAVALAYRAIQNGFDAFFTTCWWSTRSATSATGPTRRTCSSTSSTTATSADAPWSSRPTSR